MRVIAPFFAVLASSVTIFAGVVRLWWSKPRFKQGTKTYGDGGNVIHDSTVITEPKAKPWLQTAAKWWLILVVFGLTITLFVIVVYTIISLS